MDEIKTKRYLQKINNNKEETDSARSFEKTFEESEIHSPRINLDELYIIGWLLCLLVH